MLPLPPSSPLFPYTTLFRSVDVGGAAIVDLDQDLVLLVQGALHLLPEDLLVEEVGDPDANTAHLVREGGNDAAAGGADLPLAEEALGELVQRAVVAGDHVRTGGDQQLGDVHAAGGQGLQLLEEHLQVDDDAVADHRHASRGEDPGRQQVQCVLLVTDDHSVPSVVATVELHHVVHTGPRSEERRVGNEVDLGTHAV